MKLLAQLDGLVEGRLSGDEADALLAMARNDARTVEQTISRAEAPRPPRRDVLDTEDRFAQRLSVDAESLKRSATRSSQSSTARYGRVASGSPWRVRRLLERVMFDGDVFWRRRGRPRIHADCARGRFVCGLDARAAWAAADDYRA